MAAADGAVATLSEQSRKKAGRGAREKLPPPIERGVISLGRIPHGFYEDEMKRYFSQFGTVTRLKLYRSKKVTGTAPLIIRSYCVHLSDWPLQRICLH